MAASRTDKNPPSPKRKKPHRKEFLLTPMRIAYS